MSESETELIDTDLSESASTSLATRRSARIATRQGESGSEILEMSKAQGITPAPGLELLQLHDLANEVVCKTPAEDEPPCNLWPYSSTWSQTHKENTSCSSSSQV